jgi:uncharacterized protein YndB with AHSA1/START domain
LVEPDLIVQWFGPKHLSIAKVEVDLKVNGRYCFTMCKPDGKSFKIEGTYLQIEPVKQLAFTLCYQGLGSPTPPDSVVTITLQSLEQMTRLTLVQKFEIVPTDMPSRTEAWNYMLSELDHKVV